MSLAPNKASLATLTRDLNNKWQYTKESWSDAKSREFERDYIEKLVIGVETSIEIIERLDKLLTKIRKDCE